jgi:hypothetical protein
LFISGHDVHHAESAASGLVIDCRLVSGQLAEERSLQIALYSVVEVVKQASALPLAGARGKQ